MILKSNKNRLLQKARPIVIGVDKDQEPIIVMAVTRGLLDSNYNKALARLHSELKLPKREKTLVEMNETEKQLFGLRSEEDKKTKLITCYDETSPKFIEKKTEIEMLQLLISLVSYLKLDEVCVETEDGKLISHYEDFGISPTIDLYDLAKWTSDTLKITEHDITEYFLKEVGLLKSGSVTTGEMYLNSLNGTKNE